MGVDKKTATEQTPDLKTKQKQKNTPPTLVAQRKEAEQLPGGPQRFQVVVAGQVRYPGHGGVRGGPSEGLLRHLLLGHRFHYLRTYSEDKKQQQQQQQQQ